MGSTTPETTTGPATPEPELTEEELAGLETVEYDDDPDDEREPVTLPRVGTWVANALLVTSLIVGTIGALPYTAARLGQPTAHHLMQWAIGMFVTSGVLFIVSLLFAEDAMVRATGGGRSGQDDEPMDWPKVVFPALGTAFATIVATVRAWTPEQRDQYHAAFLKRRTAVWYGAGIRKAEWRTIDDLRDLGLVPAGWTDSPFRALVYLDQLMRWSHGFADVALAVYARDHGAIDSKDFARLTAWWTAAGLELPPVSDEVTGAAEIERIEQEVLADVDDTLADRAPVTPLVTPLRPYFPADE